MRLADTVSVITGGGRGIGRAIATTLAVEGSAVALLGRTPDSLEETVAAIESAGGRAAAFPLDVADGAAVSTVIAEVERSLGPVSILVNNAGIGAGGPVAESDPDEWWRVMEVNVRGPYLLSRAVLPGMIARGVGRIVNMGSNLGVRPGPLTTAYAVSKAALLRFSDSLAAEVGPAGVKVFAISPGWVWTDMTNQASEALREMGIEFELSDSDVFPPEAAATLTLRLAAGDADVLSGRYLHVNQDLDALIADADAITADDRHALRLRD